MKIDSNYNHPQPNLSKNEKTEAKAKSVKVNDVEKIIENVMQNHEKSMKDRNIEKKKDLDSLFDLDLKVSKHPKSFAQQVDDPTKYCGTKDNCTGCGCNTACSSC